jgi:hypothetical protein
MEATGDYFVLVSRAWNAKIGREGRWVTYDRHDVILHFLARRHDAEE